MTGVLFGNVLKNLKGTKIWFDGRGSNECLPLRGINTKTTHVTSGTDTETTHVIRGTNTKTAHVLSCHIFSAQYPERYRDISIVSHFIFQLPKQ